MDETKTACRLAALVEEASSKRVEDGS